MRTTDVLGHRNNIDELAAYLDGRHPDNYVVFNLSNKTRATLDYGRFHNAVEEYQPYSRTDITDDTPAMGQMFR